MSETLTNDALRRQVAAFLGTQQTILGLMMRNTDESVKLKQALPRADLQPFLYVVELLLQQVEETAIPPVCQPLQRILLSLLSNQRAVITAVQQRSLTATEASGLDMLEDVQILNTEVIRLSEAMGFR